MPLASRSAAVWPGIRLAVGHLPHPDLQLLLVALLVQFALQGRGELGASILEAVEKLQKPAPRVLIVVLWLAPIGAFGPIAAVVGDTGVDSLLSLNTPPVGFCITCAVFIVVILGALMKSPAEWRSST